MKRVNWVEKSQVGLRQVILLIAGLAFSFPVLAGPVKIQDIQTWGEEGLIPTVESLLKKLPSQYKSAHVLMHESRAMGGEDASPLFPRVIMSGDDAELLLAFYGDPGGEHFYQMEAIQFDAKRRAFDLYSIDFDPQKNSKPLIKNRTQDRACLRCHESDPRPNWEHYGQWPGAYGEDEDQHGKTTVEVMQFPLFISQIQQNSRYREISDLEFNFRLRPEESPQTERLNNTEMTTRLSKLNAQRVARLIQATPDYQKYRELIAALIFCTGENTPRAKDFDFFRDSDWNFATRAKQTIENAPFERIEGFFKKRGIDSSSWYMNFKPKRNVRSIRTAENAAEVYLNALAETDPELNSFVKTVLRPKAGVGPLSVEEGCFNAQEIFKAKNFTNSLRP